MTLNRSAGVLQIVIVALAAVAIAVLMLLPPTFSLNNTGDTVACRALAQTQPRFVDGDGVTDEQSEQIDAYIADVGYSGEAVERARQDVERGVLAVCAEVRQERIAWITVVVGAALAAMMGAGLFRSRRGQRVPAPDMSQSSFVDLVGLDAATTLANQRVMSWRDLSDRRRGFIAGLPGIDEARLGLLDEGLRQRALEWLR